MRRIATIFILMCLRYTVTAQQSYLQEHNYHGEIVQLTEMYYTVVDSFGESKNVYGGKQVYKINSYGYPTEVVGYDDRRVVAGRMVYKYKANKIIEADSFVKDKVERLITKTLYTYDTLLREINIYDEEGTLKNKITYDYNGHNVSMSSQYDEYGGTPKIFRFNYNDKGLVSKRLSYGYTNNKEYVVSFEYDDKNNLIKEEDNGTIYEFEYDSLNNVVEMSCYREGSISMEDSYQGKYVYDKYGNVIEQIGYEYKFNRWVPYLRNVTKIEYKKE